jgi:ribosomal protein S25
MAYQAHGEECTEKRVEGQTKTGPPVRHAGVIDEEVMDEVEHAVPDEGDDYEP